MGEGVPGRGQGLDLRVAEANPPAVVERVMVEVDARAGRQVGRRTGAQHQVGKAGDVVGLEVGLQDGDDSHALRLGERHVFVDEIHVRVDDRELPMRCTAEHVRGACRVVVEQLAEEHLGLLIAVRALDKLSSDLLTSNE
jgi:hypothetical protein